MRQIPRHTPYRRLPVVPTGYRGVAERRSIDQLGSTQTAEHRHECTLPNMAFNFVDGDSGGLTNKARGWDPFRDPVG